MSNFGAHEHFKFWKNFLKKIFQQIKHKIDGKAFPNLTLASRPSPTSYTTTAGMLSEEQLEVDVDPVNVEGWSQNLCKKNCH